MCSLNGTTANTNGLEFPKTAAKAKQETAGLNGSQKNIDIADVSDTVAGDIESGTLEQILQHVASIDEKLNK